MIVTLIAIFALSAGYGALTGALVLTARSRGAQPIRPGELPVMGLATFALAGMMVFVAANNLLVMFVALEVLSLPLYLLCGLARRRRLLSQEAVVKY